jgi:hypothetical protein
MKKLNAENSELDEELAFLMKQIDFSNNQSHQLEAKTAELKKGIAI